MPLALILSAVLTLTFTNSEAQDNWNGGTGNWSNGSDWSAGLPGAGSDVVIYSGGNDLVTLDVGSTTINSLTLGGPVNGVYVASELADGGTKQALTITNALTVGETGFLYFTGGSKVSVSTDSSNAGTIWLFNGSTLSVAGNLNNSNTIATSTNGGGSAVNVSGMLTNDSGAQLAIFGSGDMASLGSITNNGVVFIGYGATLNLANQPGGVTDVPVGSRWEIYGKFTEGGTNSGFEKLANIAGIVDFNSQSLTITPGVGTLTISNGGALTADNYSGPTTLTIHGGVDNSGTLATTFYGGGGNTVTINGLLTNEATGQINLNGPGDLLQALGGLTNYGLITVNNGSTIDPPFVTNIGTINIGSMSKLVVGTGGYTQLANGTLGEMISATNYGVINVNGSALLDGTLAVVLQGGFNPAVGSMYKFLFANPGQISGVFANIENDIFNGGTEKWLVGYDNADGYVELIAENNGVPVPEPATLLVLIPGLLGAGYGLRRRLLQ